MTNDIRKKIEELVNTNDIVLFMKGSAEKPMCGFSSTVVQILKMINIPFKYINVMEDPEIRQGIKDYSNWPTIPQLYIKGEFIGGCDITREMFQTGELQNLLKEKQILVA